MGDINDKPLFGVLWVVSVFVDIIQVRNAEIANEMKFVFVKARPGEKESLRSFSATVPGR